MLQASNLKCTFPSIKYIVLVFNGIYVKKGLSYYHILLYIHFTKCPSIYWNRICTVIQKLLEETGKRINKTDTLAQQTFLVYIEVGSLLNFKNKKLGGMTSLIILSVFIYTVYYCFIDLFLLTEQNPGFKCLCYVSNSHTFSMRSE